jgi:hypothetical protein
MAELFNRAKMTTSSTGTGTLTLGSVVAGFQTFAQAGVTNGDTVRYVIEDGVNFEIGVGVYTASGTTLSRGNVSESTSSDSEINLSGNATVSITATALDIGVTPVADQSAMLALTNPSLGNMAYRQDNQKLVMYNGSGWYSVATINTAPTISAVSQTTAGATTSLSAGGTFALNNGNNNTVITITATDPEPGSTLTYSYAVTNGTSLGSAATVSQSNNVFTIDPSSDTAGSFQLTFSVTDGSNTATFVQNFTLTFAAIASWLLVAGGGAGGRNFVSAGGGGGAGQVLAATDMTMTMGSALTITIGAGGTAATNAASTDGGDSVFGTYTSKGGGAGGGYTGSFVAANPGGSGGGASDADPNTRAGGVSNKNTYTGTTASGNAGGERPASPNERIGGGGGGAGAAGQDYSGSNAGNGGVGITSTLLPSANATSLSVGQVDSGSVYFGGGGGAGVWNNYSSKSAGTGGLGGGSLGGQSGNSYTAPNASSNTGGGGGASGWTGSENKSGNGGSGVFILRTEATPTSVSNNESVITVGSDNIYVWKQSGSITF